MIGWLVALGVITAVALLPVKVWLRYDDLGGNAALHIGPVRIQLYPSRSKAREDTQEAESGTSQKKASENSGGKLSDFLPLIETVFHLLRDLRQKLVISPLELKFTLADDDPGRLGVNYGGAWALAGNVMPLLENTFRIKKRSIEVACDFFGEQSKVYARACLRISIFSLLRLLCKHGFSGIKQYFNIINKRKGGAVS